MIRATVHVDLSNKSCVITTRRRFHGAWGPDITRRAVEAVIAVDGWRFRPGSEWVMTVDGGTRQVERPGPIRRLIDRIRDARAIHASDRLLDRIGSAMPPTPTDRLTALLTAWRNDSDSPAGAS